MRDAGSYSFELFPPRNDKSALGLRRAVKSLATLGPQFFSVTFGAGGSARSGTYETVMNVHRITGVEVAPHLSCLGATRANVAAALDAYIAAGVRHIVALRGDLPAGQREAGAFRYAADLVAFIREHSGDHFRIEVAAYPEYHPQALHPDADIDNLRRKLEAGASGAMTQYFYNADAYFRFVESCRARGIDASIVPGIMPITNYAQLARFSDACGAEIPRWIRMRLENLQNDRDALVAFGIDVVTGLCERLLDNGAPGLHFYTLNRAAPTATIWRNLGLSDRSTPERANAR